MSKTEKKRDTRLRKTYGLTLGQWNTMWSVQGGLCFICLKANPLHTDHDHKTKVVRGLLCFRCNKYRIGRAHKEDAIYFRRAAVYLERDFDGRKL